MSRRATDMKLDKADHHTLALWAADCAEHVLPLFESANPDDDRPRRAIEAARAWARDDMTITQARAAAFSAHAAARETTDPAARAAARSAGHAAATAHVSTHAPHAAAYALKSVAASASLDALAATAAERAWQLQNLPFHLHPLASPSSLDSPLKVPNLHS